MLRDSLVEVVRLDPVGLVVIPDQPVAQGLLDNLARLVWQDLLELSVPREVAVQLDLPVLPVQREPLAVLEKPALPVFQGRPVIPDQRDQLACRASLE